LDSQSSSIFTATRGVVFAGDRIVLISKGGMRQVPGHNIPAHVYKLLSLDPKTGEVKDTREISAFRDVPIFATNDAHVIVAGYTVLRLTPDLKDAARWKSRPGCSLARSPWAAKSLQYADSAASHRPGPLASTLRPRDELELRCLNTDQHLSFEIQCPRDARVAPCLDVRLTVGQKGARRCSALATFAGGPIEMHAAVKKQGGVRERK
jgi:hypothetical protein